MWSRRLYLTVRQMLPPAAGRARRELPRTQPGLVLAIAGLGILAIVLALVAGHLTNDTSSELNQIAAAQGQVSERDCEIEYQTLQVALLVYMQNNHLDSIPPATTTDMTQPLVLYVNSRSQHGRLSYVPFAHTHWAFTWDGSGWINAISEAANGPFIPSGCTLAGPRTILISGQP